MFSNDKNIETIGQLVEVTKHYIGLQTRYAKLDVMVKIVRLLTVATMALLLSVLLMLALIYLPVVCCRFCPGNSLGQRPRLLCCGRLLSLPAVYVYLFQKAMDRETFGAFPCVHIA